MKLKLLFIILIIFIGYNNVQAQQKGYPPNEMAGSPADLHKRITISRTDFISTLTEKDPTLSFIASGKIKGNPLFKGSGSKDYQIDIIGTDNNILQTSSTIVMPHDRDELNDEINRQALFVLTATGKEGVDWYYKQLPRLKGPDASFTTSTVIYSLTKITVEYFSASRSLCVTITSL